MKATFSMRKARVRDGGKTVERDVEWIEVSGFPAGDVVSRRARPADRDRFKPAYQAFLAAQKPASPPVEAPHPLGRGAAKRVGDFLKGK